MQRFRERVGPRVDVLWVLPDFYEEQPKPCMGGWGRTAIVVAPNGEVSDWGGCRCQSLRLTGDAAATDPVCRFSPHHDRVVAARGSGENDELIYRTMKRPARV